MQRASVVASIGPSFALLGGFLAIIGYFLPGYNLQRSPFAMGVVTVIDPTYGAKSAWQLLDGYMPGSPYLFFNNRTADQDIPFSLLLWLVLLAALITLGLAARAFWPPRPILTVVTGVLILTILFLGAADNLLLALGLLLPALALMGLACALPARARAWLEFAAPLVGVLALAASVAEFLFIASIFYQIGQPPGMHTRPPLAGITAAGSWLSGIGFLMGLAGTLLMGIAHRWQIAHKQRPNP